MGLLQQLLPVLGVMIGALGSFLVITAGDRARFRRDQTVRWSERRLTAYTEYAGALKTTMSLLYRVAGRRVDSTVPYPLDPIDAVTPLGDAYAASDLAWEAVLMLGSQTVIEAGRSWSRAVRKMEWLAADETFDPESWAKAVAAAREARGSFYQAVRDDLRMPSAN